MGNAFDDSAVELMAASARAAAAGALDRANHIGTQDAGTITGTKTSAFISDFAAAALAAAPAETPTSAGALVNAAGAATPNNGDFVATAESGGLLKKITWTGVKAFLKTYFDTLYLAVGTGGEANTASNVGLGEGVFAQKDGVDLEFKSVISSDGSINVTSDPEHVIVEVNPAAYQVVLISGTNIKTINGSSVLGAGDLVVSGAPAAANPNLNLIAVNTTIPANYSIYYPGGVELEAGIEFELAAGAFAEVG